MCARAPQVLVDGRCAACMIVCPVARTRAYVHVSFSVSGLVHLAWLCTYAHIPRHHKPGGRG